MALLKVLDDAAMTFAGLPGPTDLGDVADFERGVRDLRRIVLSRR